MANSVDVKELKEARHLLSQQSSYADVSTVQTTQIDSSIQDSAKLDSTNMFHWCPAQSLASCLFVSVALHRTDPTHRRHCTLLNVHFDFINNCVKLKTSFPQAITSTADREKLQFCQLQLVAEVSGIAKRFSVSMRSIGIIKLESIKWEQCSAVLVGGCRFVKQLQKEEGDGGVCGYCCYISRNTVRKQLAHCSENV